MTVVEGPPPRFAAGGPEAEAFGASMGYPIGSPATFWGEGLTLDDYLARNPTTGLLIARGDEILVERYQYGRADRHRFTSFSMAKTVTAMLVGIAIDEGRIRSVDDLAAAYVPALAGTEYGRTSLRHLLQMSSGVGFNENFRPGSTPDDALQLILGTYLRAGPGGVGAVTPFDQREHTIPASVLGRANRLIE
jgi:CubicO group peptidase (beta-lactamase class C family)